LAALHPTRELPRGEVQTFSGKLQAAAATKPVPVTSQDGGAALLRFRGGARGNMWVSQAAAGRKNSVRFEIAGAEATLAWNGEKPNTLWIGHRDRANGCLLRDPAFASREVRPFMSLPGATTKGIMTRLSTSSGHSLTTSGPAT
jgi:predicted dehydrogenase